MSQVELSGILLSGILLSEEEAKEILRSLANSLIESIEKEQYNLTYNILYQDEKFESLVTNFYDMYQSNQIQEFVKIFNESKKDSE